MAEGLIKLQADPRWLQLVDRYAGDPVRFGMEVCSDAEAPPLSLQQQAILRAVAPGRSRVSVASGHGCFAAGTKLMRADGQPVAVEDVQVGDRLMGPDGASVREVQQLRRGREAMHRITYEDGTFHVFNESHLLCLVAGDRLIKVAVSDWLAWDSKRREDHSVYRLRAAAGNGKSARYRTLEITGAEPLGEGDYFGFTLDDDGRFLAADGTVLSNTGKTFSLAIVAFWHLVCFGESHTLLTANDIDQLKTSFWKEFGKLINAVERGPFAWLAAHVEVLADGTARIRGYENTWFIESKTANNKNANKMAGRHGKHYMIIADEGSSIPDPVLITLSGGLTEAWNRFLITSQFTRTQGFFARTQTELSKEQGGVWDALQLSSFESPFVSDEALREMWDQYDDDERAVRLLGLPPQNPSGLMMGQKDALAMYKRGRIIKPGEAFGWVVPSDVASGEGVRDKSASLVARVVGWGDRGPNARRVEVVRIPIFTNGIRSNRLAGHVMDAGADLPNATFVTDSGGLGINVCQDIEDAGRILHRVNWGNPCFRNENKDRYINLRAQAMHHAARAAKEGRLSILTDDYKRVMVAQASRVPKRFGNRGRMQVPEKHSPEWEGLPSPDLWDAVCFLFLENVSYVATSAAAEDGGTTVSSALQRMRANRAALLQSLPQDEAPT